MTDFVGTHNGFLPSRPTLRLMGNCQIKYEVLRTVLQKQNDEITALYHNTTDTIQETAGNAISESKHFPS